MNLPRNLALAAALFAVPAHGAITMVNGGENHPSLLQNQADWTLDLGVALPLLPTNPGVALVESGGDGLGFAAVIAGSNLIVYHDNGDFNVSSPDVDTFMSYDLSSFSGQVVTMRAVGSFGTATDTIAVSILGNDAASFSDTISMVGDTPGGAGGNRFGFGGVAQDLAGLDESVEDGFPDMAAFSGPDYDVDNLPFGANVLGPDRIKGIVYTEGDAAPSALPEPSSWGLTAVPEPSTGLLSLFGVALLLRRRRS